MCEFHKLCLRWRTLDNNVRIFIETQIISSLHKPAIMQKKAIEVYHKRSFEKFLITQTFSYNRIRVWMHSNYTSILLFTIVVTLIACIANASNSTIIWERTVINKVLALWPPDLTGIMSTNSHMSNRTRALHWRVIFYRISEARRLIWQWPSLCPGRSRSQWSVCYESLSDNVINGAIYSARLYTFMTLRHHIFIIPILY